VLSLVLCVAAVFAVTQLYIFSFLYSVSYPLHSEASALRREINRLSYDGIRRVVSSSHSARVAVLIPYFGTSLPQWFNAFMFSAQYSSDILDWFIFVTDPRNISTPNNVRVIYMPEFELLSRVVRVDPVASVNGSASINIWTMKFTAALRRNPYILVEFKPCLGWIFQDYLHAYSHWAFADVDILVGRASLFITPDILSVYDIYTSSFGDNSRMYMRGQLTVFRNSDYINTLWRHCDHFTELNKRIERYLLSPEQPSSRSKGWPLQSAEGCISRVVTGQNNISIRLGTTQISDAFHAPSSERESIFMGGAVMRCYQGPLDIEKLVLGGYLLRRPHWIQNSTAFPLRPVENPSCEYWVSPKYQVCLNEDAVTRDAEISWYGLGNISFTRASYSVPSVDGSQCREGMISHFQGWKRDYYHFSTRPPSLDTHIMLIAREGFIPLRLPSLLDIPNIGTTLSAHYMRATVASLTTRSAVGSLYSRLKEGSALTQSYIHQQHREIFTGAGSDTTYCIKFSADLRKCLRYLSRRDINLRRVKVPTEEAQAEDGSTLVVVGCVSDILSGAMTDTVSSWKGSQVCFCSFFCYFIFAVIFRWW